MSFTFADHKLGGRLTAACEAIGAGHLRRAAGIFAELADDLNAEAEGEDGLMAEAPLPTPVQTPKAVQSMDLQMCSRNVHSYSEPDPITGWRTCATCGIVNVAP